MRAHLAILVSAVLLAACGGTDADLVNPGGLASHVGVSGGGGGGGNTLSCTFSASDECLQVAGTLSSTQQSDFQTTCSALGGSNATGSCSTSGAVAGYCSFSGDPLLYGATGEWRAYYYPPTYDTTSAQSACSSIPGTWN